MDIKIVEATEKDINVIIFLMEKLYTELGEEKEAISFLNKSFILEIINSGHTKILKALTPTMEVCGMLTLTETQSIYAGGKYGVIDELYVPKLHRSLNIGKKLIKRAKEIAEENRWNRIDVTTPTENNNDITDFYKKNGFAFTGSKLKCKIHHNLSFEEKILNNL